MRCMNMEQSIKITNKSEESEVTILKTTVLQK